MVKRITRKTLNAACPDDSDPNALPIVSAKESVAGMATVLTALLIDGDRAWWDDAACHGRTPLEQGLEWADDPAEVPGARRVFVVWVYIKPDRQSRQYTYHGVVAVDMLIDEEAKRGYKRLGHHANQLGAAMRGKIDLEILTDDARRILAEELAKNEGVLENSSPELLEALGQPSPN